MMFLVYLSLITVAAVPLQPMSNNEQLLQSLNTADPKAVKMLKDYVNGLISKGLEDIEKYTTIANDAQTAFDGATTRRNKAKTALDAATTHHTESVTAEKNAANLEKDLKKVREQKAAHEKETESKLVMARETDRVEQIRLNKEKALFEKVQRLLNDIKASDRRLLDAKSDIAPILALINVGSNADPAQVKEANKLLDELIAQGETERQGYIAALREAESVNEKAKQEHSKAKDAHIQAMGALERAKEITRDALEKLNLRSSEHAQRVKEYEAAEADLKTKKATLEKESTRIKGEELDLKRIIDLLNKLD